ncbi:Sel1 domain protein repeat-containing protein [Seminavis robusta]|uniref:Sel1 domain protein repeat-containing protein n=1 Tax=Seminavis robusta TaxID=568900 RepID=A0A9N8ENL9_9STRA|nr:Sel1 domain protein repeat-containing protein [Seminavis robusta]|eukprot:Sro1438_g272650.1 Sel1 domain protein repeat-containing protein (246) ;mRNA; r:2028-2765
MSSANKRKRDPADELICPISLELPWDPVTAEDGRVYERISIETHIKNHPRGLKSPITNKKMGKKLVPAIQHRNMTDILVEDGVILGDLAAKWKEKVNQKKEMEELLKKADAGGACAMYNLGVNYENGYDGFNEDEKLAFQWYSRAHKAGNVRGTSSVGMHLLNGWGVAKNEKLGLVHLSSAAGQGSNYAAKWLGVAFANGEYGLSVDKAMAISWLEKAVGDCPEGPLTDESIQDAQQELDELKSS